MRTYRALFKEVCSFGNLVLAYRRARKRKRSRPDVVAFDLAHEDRLIELETELREQTYEPGHYRNFYIYEPKKRIISAAPFRCRVVHHAICNVIEPIFERSFVHDSYSCRVGKGTHAALDRFTRYARQYPLVLKCDVVQYFPSVDHELLRGMLRRRVADERLMALIERILASGKDVFGDERGATYFPGDDLFAALRPRGLPIGNLTSQFFANVFLDPLDHFVKDELGEKAYLRYCDDFVVFGRSRERLMELRERSRRFLQGLRLRLHQGKSVVYRVKDGTPFLGFLVFPDHRRLLRKSAARARRRFRQLAEAFARGEVDLPEARQRVMAWLGHARHGDTWGLRRRVLGSLRLRRDSHGRQHTDLCEDVRLEPLAVPEDERLPEAVPPFAGAANGERHAPA